MFPFLASGTHHCGTCAIVTGRATVEGGGFWLLAVSVSLCNFPRPSAPLASFSPAMAGPPGACMRHDAASPQPQGRLHRTRSDTAGSTSGGGIVQRNRRTLPSRALPIALLLLIMSFSWDAAEAARHSSRIPSSKSSSRTAKPSPSSTRTPTPSPIPRSSSPPPQPGQPTPTATHSPPHASQCSAVALTTYTIAGACDGPSSPVRCPHVYPLVESHARGIV